MPFMAGEVACPSALSRAPVFGVHRSAAKTLDRRSGRIRRTVWPGRAVKRSLEWNRVLETREYAESGCAGKEG